MALNLNPNAQAFVPVPVPGPHASDIPEFGELEDLFYAPEPNRGEYEEMRAADEWVETMADLSLQEESHLINIALRHADSSQVEEIQARAHVEQQQLYYEQQQMYYYQQAQAMQHRPQPHPHAYVHAYQPQLNDMANVYPMASGRNTVMAQRALPSCAQHKSCAAAGGPCMHRVPRNGNNSMNAKAPQFTPRARAVRA